MSNFISNINPITVLFLIVLLIPLIKGFIRGLESHTTLYSIQSFFETSELIFSTLISFFITKSIFFDVNSYFHQKIFLLLPISIREALYAKDIFIYLIFVPFLVFLIMFLIRLISTPFYSKMVDSIHSKLFLKLTSISSFTKKMISLFLNIPKSILIIIILSLLVNFSFYFMTNQKTSNWAHTSTVYNSAYEKLLKPLLHSNLAKDLKIVNNNSFIKKSPNKISNLISNVIYTLNPKKKSVDDANYEKKYNLSIKKYFNEKSIDEVVTSSNRIDDIARFVTKDIPSSREKAFAIYTWILSNIEYDQEKALKINDTESTFITNSKETFINRQGISFDYSALFVSMSRSAGLKCNFVTGLAYSGISWGDHSWNQVFIPEENLWIDVDTTFGAIDNYYDKKDFSVDHRDPKILKTWN